MSQYITGSGDITNPRAWQDVTAPNSVPPLEFNNVQPGTNYPLNGDGRYWWNGNAANPLTTAVLLMHMDGANGASGNSAFVDSSPYNHTFSAVNAGPALDTSIFKYGTASANCGSYTSPSNGVARTTPQGSEYNLTGDFTQECWVYVNPNNAGSKAWDQRGPGNVDIGGVSFTVVGGTTVHANFGLTAGAQTNNPSTFAVTFPVNTWTHIALVQQGLTVSLYVNGVLSSSGAWASTPAYPTTSFIDIGGDNTASFYFQGHIDDFRFVNGSAVYTGPFTPPTAALTSGASAVIKFIGDPVRRVTGTMSLQWQITQYSTDGSVPYLQYSTDGGATFTVTPLGGGQAPQSGAVNVSLSGNTGLQVGIYFQGGTASATAPKSYVALAITRNKNEGMTYDWSNPLDPLVYNSSRSDNPGYLSDTLANLRNRLLIRLGFSNQATNPPPGMAAFCNEMLSSAQTYLYRRYSTLHMLRMFRWKMVPGQRYYGVNDNDEDILGAFKINPTRPIQWAGVQDVRNVWYPLIQGIPPQLYTMIDKPWRPARYEIKSALEIYPAPDQTYWLWLKGYTGLSAFASDTDITSIDSELVFLHALANAKAHYGQPDANNIEAQANAYKAELIAGTHQTAHYVPGMVAVPPAIRPTLIGFDQN